MSFTPNNDGKYIYSQYEATLANGAEIDSGWIDYEKVDKIQVEGLASAIGITMVITSSNVSGGGEADVTSTTTIDTTFHLFNVIARQRWIRIQWQNNTGGGLTDCALSIKETFGSSDKLSVFAANVEPSPFSQAALVQAIMRGKDTHGAYQNVSVNPNGELQTARYSIDAARGELSNISSYNKFGDNKGINTNTVPQDIWENGDIYTGFDATAGEVLRVTSTSTSDAGTLVSNGTATGGTTTTLIDTGATFITDGVAVGDIILNDTQIFHGVVSVVTSETVLTVWRWDNSNEGHSHTVAVSDVYRVATTASTGAAVIKLQKLLESDYDGYKTEYIITNGTTSVLTVGTDYLRSSRAKVLLSGSNDATVGAITGRQNVTTANIFWTLEAEENQTQVCCDTIPKGVTGFVWVLVQMSRANGSAGSASMKFLVRPVGQVFEEKVVVEITSSLNYSSPTEKIIVLPEYSDFKWHCEDVSDNGTNITAEIDGYQITNE